MAYTITDDADTTDLGSIQTDGSDENNGLIPITLPESNSEDALLIPTTGPQLYFKISGIKTGNISTLQAFISKLSKWVSDGGKLSKSNIIYNSELDGTGLSVRAVRYSKSWVSGDPNKLGYTLDLVRGSFS
jgi:hypothetical protein